MLGSRSALVSFASLLVASALEWLVPACSSASSAASDGPGSSNDGGANDAANDAGTNLDPTSMTAAGFEAALAKLDCQFEAKCGFLAASEEAACEANVAASAGAVVPYSNVAAVADGRLAFDPAKSQACLDASKTKGCFDQLGPSAICSAVYSGTVAIGGACRADAECAGGVCDRGTTIHDGCPGTCKAFSADGAGCGLQDTACSPADYCDTSVTNTCKPRSAAAAACDANVGPFCAQGLFCVGTTCEAPGGGAGAACAAGFFGSSCAGAFACDDSGKCAARQAAGGGCASFDACDDGLDCVGLTFDPNTGATATNGACAAYLDVGSACDATLTESGCPGGTACDGATHACVKVGVAGADCNTGNLYCREGFYCDGTPGKCQPVIAVGGACTAQTNGADVSCYPSTQCDAATKTCVLVCK